MFKLKHFNLISLFNVAAYNVHNGLSYKAYIICLVTPDVSNIVCLV